MSKTKVSCPIWGPDHEATVIQDKSRVVEVGIDATDETVIVDSDRAGGKYEITGEGQLSLRVLGDSEKARLTTWLVDQRIQGIETPVVTEEIVEYTRNRRPLQVHERAERLLQFIAKQSDGVGSDVLIRFFNSDSDTAALAWSESTEWREVDYFFDYLREIGLLSGRHVNSGFLAKVTVKGHTRIAEQATNLNSSQAFVAMWFHESMSKAYEDGIRPAIEQARYNPLRIDQKEHINKIDDEIIAEIRRSRFVVADFTQGADGARGGVYYEAGFARALGLPVIFTCRQDSLEDLHFDTEHYNHIVWTDENGLREKLKNRILAVIGEGPETQSYP